MVPWRATEDGFVTEDVLEWYGRFAMGRPGGIVIEATGVRDIPSGPLLRVGHDRFVPGLSKLVDRVRRASGGRTRIFLQLIDFLSIRRRPDPEKYFQRYLEITDRHRAALADRATSDDECRDALLACSAEEIEMILSAAELEALRFGYRERVTDMRRPHVRELPSVLPTMFADAARRAQSAGFDGVELHYAHAYTMASFLSALNDRSDGYGGSRANRVRLPLEVFRAVRANVDASFVVGCRYLSDECVEGGSTEADAVEFGAVFAAAGMDFLSLSRGGKFEDARQPKVGWATYPYTGRSGWECMPTVLADDFGPFGRNVAAATRIRQTIRAAGLATPVVVSGGICSFAQSETILAEGGGDIIGSARQSLADPDWFLKVQTGHGHQVRRCVFTNYCEGLDQKHKQVTCKLWDRLEGPEDVARSHDGKRRLVAPPWSPDVKPDPS